MGIDVRAGRWARAHRRGAAAARRAGCGRRAARAGMASLLTLLAAGAVSAAAGAAPGRLPVLTIDRSQTTVSGLSSGGYMAGQLHVAWSSVFGRGAGIVAAGPYGCAEGQLATALKRCMRGEGSVPLEKLQATARHADERGWIDPLAGLAASRVYVFAGAADQTVKPALATAAAAWYAPFVSPASVRLRTDVPAAHAMVTDGYGAACDARGAPYINNCGVDLVGDLLQHLLGPLQPRQAGPLWGALHRVDQSAYIAGQGMASDAWLYVPADCAAGARCRLHVALHGCHQNTAEIGDVYVQHAGYNRWADSNRIVVLYPQTGDDAPNGCWDWWGYSAYDFALRNAPQMGAIVAMTERLSGVRAVCHTALNARHGWAGRGSYANWWGGMAARGSGQPIGNWGQTTTLRESPRGHFTIDAARECA